MKKGQKQGRDEKNARRLQDVCCVLLQMSASLLAFFLLCLVSVLFQLHPELKLGAISKTLFQLTMELKKGQKQDRDERKQEDYRTSAKIHS